MYMSIMCHINGIDFVRNWVTIDISGCHQSTICNLVYTDWMVMVGHFERRRDEQANID